MEKIKVNMSPNPLDVQTIHASQNDGEARQWEFELHNNGELIDTSEVTEQLFFKAYKGGTEQILPENTSTPTTSPFLGDIRYPQGLLTDQEFLYRQSPTEEDGLAKITDIKGNTLVWNQLVQNGNFESTSGYGQGGCTFAVANNECTITLQGVYAYLYRTQDFTTGHTILVKVDAKTSVANGCTFFVNYPFYANIEELTTSYKTYYFMGTVEESKKAYLQLGFSNNVANQTVVLKNFNAFDLTVLNDSHITDYNSFKTYFPLSYYAYNSGSLLNFNGTGIKTVGKNLLNPSFTTINAYINGSGVITLSSNDKSVIVPLLPNLSYVFTWNRGEILSSVTDDAQVGLYNEYPSIGMRGVFAGNTSVSGNNIRFNSGTNKYAVIKIANITRTDFDSTIIASQLEIGSSATSYEPYTSSTLSLPISTYFPTGMKSAGSVYDELTPTKAVTRIGSVDLGSLSYNYATSSGVNYFFSTSLPVPAQAQGEMSNIKSSLYTPKTVMGTIGQGLTENMTMVVSATGYVCFRNDDITSATAFNQAMSGVYLYYELATPTETSFTTASLVTENAEIPLSNNDGVLIGKCTEQLSENPGFIDAKIKLSDSDGECYSNKIQLHVERSPQ